MDRLCGYDGFVEPRKGRLFLAWRREPQEFRLPREGPDPRKGATERVRVVMSDRNPVIARRGFVCRTRWGLRSTLGVVPSRFHQSWG